jgi:hypothetical protein
MKKKQIKRNFYIVFTLSLIMLTYKYWDMTFNFINTKKIENEFHLNIDGKISEVNYQKYYWSWWYLKPYIIVASFKYERINYEILISKLQAKLQKEIVNYPRIIDYDKGKQWNKVQWGMLPRHKYSLPNWYKPDKEEYRKNFAFWHPTESNTRVILQFNNGYVYILIECFSF